MRRSQSFLAGVALAVSSVLLGTTLAAVPSVQDPAAQALAPTSLVGKIGYLDYEPSTRLWRFSYLVEVENVGTYCSTFASCGLVLRFYDGSGSEVFNHVIFSTGTRNGIMSNETSVRNFGASPPSEVVAARFNLSHAPGTPHLLSAWVPLPGGVLPEEMVGGDGCQCDAADPVNTATGEFYLNHADLSLAGAGPAVEVQRSYSSTRATTSGSLGYGWMTALDARVEVTTPGTLPAGPPATVQVIRETGAATTYELDTGGGYVAAAHVADRLVRHSSGSSVWEFIRGDGSSLAFDADGRLVAISDRVGNIATVARDASGKAISISGGGGRSIQLTWSSGRIAQLTDSAGRSVSYSYNSTGELTGVTDPRGFTTAYAYAAGHLLNQITTPEGGVTKNTYTGGRVTKQVDPLGRATTFVYHTYGTYVTYPDRSASDNYTNGVLTRRSVVDAGVTVSTIFSYDRENRLVGTTDALGATATSTYDTNSFVASTTDALGRTASFTNDARGNSLTITDPLGRVSTMSYDVNGSLLTSTSPAGVHRSWVYNGDGTVAAATDGTGAVTGWTYDTRGLPLCVTAPDGGATCLGYDAAGFVTSVTDPSGAVTSFVRDAGGNVTSTTDAEGRVSAYTYDRDGRPLSVAEPGGGVRSAAYDAAGQVTSVTDEDGAVTRYTYTPGGQVKTVTDPLGGVTTSNYTQGVLLASVTDPLGRVTSYGYDKARRLTKVVEPSGAATSYAYDATGQRTSVKDPLGKVTTLAYDANGQLTSVTDPLGRATSYAYDPDGRVSSTTPPDGHPIGFGYDAEGRTTSYTSADGEVTSYSYDLAGRLSGKAEPGGMSTGYAYDAAGRLSTLTRPDGTAVGWSYDDTGLPLAIDYPGAAADVAFTYTADRQRASMTDATGTTSYTYTPTGRLAGVSTGAGASLSYGYDTAGRMTTLGYPGARSASYTYDAAGQLTSITDWNGAKTIFGWSADSLPTSEQFPNGLTESRSYDLTGQLTGQLLAGTSTAAALDYTYDAAGQLLTATVARARVPTATRSYGYDALGQLASLTNGGPARAITATSDSLLTLLSDGTTQSFDARQQLVLQTPTAGPAVTFGYDDNGSRTRRTIAASGLGPAEVTDYGYDAAGALNHVGLPDGSTVDYLSDGDGLRQSRTDATGSTQLLWNTNAAVPLLIDDGEYSYLYGIGLTPYARIAHADGATQYLHSDVIGSVRTITDSSGAVVGGADYGEYGARIASTGSTSAFGFSGNLTDPATGLVYLRARDYDPTSGQFMQVDPAVDRTRQAYAYAGNAPTFVTDPTGLDPTADLGAGLLAFGAGVLDDVTMGGSSLLLGALVPGYDCFTQDNPWFEAGQMVSSVVTTVVLVATGVGAVVALARLAVKFGVKAGVKAAFSLVRDRLVGWAKTLRGPGAGGAANAVPPRFITTGGGVTIDRVAVNSTVSAQRQGRHVLGARQYGGGSYFNSADDAQGVLDAFHSGGAQVLGTKGNDIVVRVPGITGFNHNPGAGFPNQATNVFFIKGSSSPSVVPYNPAWKP